MNHVQRRHHSRAWIVLGPLLLLLIAAALWVRPPRLAELRPAARGRAAGDAPIAAGSSVAAPVAGDGPAPLAESRP